MRVALLPKGSRGGSVQATLNLHFGDEKTLFVANGLSDDISVVDIAARKVIDTVPLPWKLGNRLKITPDGRTALVAATSLAAIDIATKQVRTLDIGPAAGEGILITPDSKKVLRNRNL